MSLFYSVLWFCMYVALSSAGTNPLTEAFWICSSSDSFAPKSAYAFNLQSLISSLNSNADQENGFFHTVKGNGSDAVYGIFLCRGDQLTNECKACVASAINDLAVNCTRMKVAIIWNPQCMVRYSNKSFLGTMDESPGMYAWNGLYPLDYYTSDTTGFQELMLYTVGDVAKKAAQDPSGSEKKYATEQTSFGSNLTQAQNLHSYAQCTPDLSQGDCYNCLQAAIKNLSVSCGMMVGCWMMFPSCTIRYDVLQIYSNIETLAAPPAPQSAPVLPTLDTTSSTPGEGRARPMRHTRRRLLIVGAAIASALTVVLLLVVWILVYKRKSQEAAAADVDAIETVNSLKFEFNTIRTATNDFSVDRKLGEGGFGDVFKGTLESGQEIAVKRLSRNSKQGIAQLKTEIVLVAKLQHKNLVQLLGFCITRTEKLLVYEFLPNSSLDRFLFDSTRGTSLDWETRYKIICGIAKGLLYLHEDSRLKVIHRDLKSSNILLDKYMNPKISDFGLAKLFGAGESHANTVKIAGTFGYMAPEYLKEGRFSMKSDVYSFGIIILEIISGQRNYFGRQLNEEALVQRAWRLWNDGLAMEFIDSKIGDNFSGEQIARCIQIGLLCIQEDAARRPTIGFVVMTLSNDAVTLPSPRLPNYFSRNVDNEIQECWLNQSSMAFTGSENITDLCPR